MEKIALTVWTSNTYTRSETPFHTLPPPAGANLALCRAVKSAGYVSIHTCSIPNFLNNMLSWSVERLTHQIQPVTELQAAPLSNVGFIDSEVGWNVFLGWEHSHRFPPLCLPVLPWLFAVLPKLHCADCFFLGTGTLAFPLKAFVGSSLLRWESPAGSVKLSSLLKVSGWYSDAHCCRGNRR